MRKSALVLRAGSDLRPLLDDASILGGVLHVSRALYSMIGMRLYQTIALCGLVIQVLLDSLHLVIVIKKDFVSCYEGWQCFYLYILGANLGGKIVSSIF